MRGRNPKGKEKKNRREKKKKVEEKTRRKKKGEIRGVVVEEREAGKNSF